MAFFAGIAGNEASVRSDDSARRLRAIATTYAFGGGKPSVWCGDGAAFVHVPWATTPEDRLDRLPGRLSGGEETLVFDGRLDNRDDLLSELGIDRERGAVMGDGALVMAALERWGNDASGRLLGDFAYARWNRRARRLVLECDAVGGRTIYAHAGPRRICFATLPIAVLAFPDVPREIDRVAIGHHLLSTPIPAGATLFRDVFRLPPAGRLVWQDGQHRIERYWRLDPGRRIRYRDSREYVEHARELLDRAVEAQLRVVGPLVCQLSGGLDSSAVTATAARLRPDFTIHALTTVPEPMAPLPPPSAKRVYDEGSLAAATAALYSNVEHHILPAGALTADEVDPTRRFARTGLPIRNFLNFGTWQPAYALARELGARVVFSANTGNATLSWEDMARWPFWRRQMVESIPPAFARRLRRWLGKPVDHWARRSAITRDFAEEIRPDAILASVPFALGHGRQNRNARLRFIERHWVRRPFHASLVYSTGTESRDPLSDRRLAEFCFAIPSREWRLGGVSRSFARRVLSDRLPPAVLAFTGYGYQNGEWFHRQSGLCDALMAEIDRLEASPTARHMLDLPRLRALGNDWPADAAAAERRREEILVAFGRTLYFGRFIRWVEGSNG